MMGSGALLKLSLLQLHHVLREFLDMMKKSPHQYFGDNVYAIKLSKNYVLHPEEKTYRC